METARVVLPPQIQPIQLCDLLDPAFLRMATVADASIPSTVTWLSSVKVRVPEHMAQL
jgi:hypothetical protein